MVYRVYDEGVLIKSFRKKSEFEKFKKRHGRKYKYEIAKTKRRKTIYDELFG